MLSGRSQNGPAKGEERFFLTQKEAEQARRRFLAEFERSGDAVFSREDLTFEQLAERYRKTRLIPAEYIDGKKVAGHRELTLSGVWLIMTLMESCLKSEDN